MPPDTGILNVAVSANNLLYLLRKLLLLQQPIEVYRLLPTNQYLLTYCLFTYIYSYLIIL